MDCGFCEEDNVWNFCFLKIVSVAEELSAVEQCSDVVEGRDLHHGRAANKSAGSVDMMR